MAVVKNGRGAKARAGAKTLASAGLALALAGCSMAQKADVFGWFSDDDTAKPADAANKPASTDEPYPNLGDVPGRPTRPPAIDRDKIAQTLAADRENAQYTEDVLRRVGESAPPPRPAAATRPAPPAPAVTAAPLPPAAPSPPPQVAAVPPQPAAALPPPVPPAPAAPAAPIVREPNPDATAEQPIYPQADPNQPAVVMRNNRPVVNPGYTPASPPPAVAAAPSPPSEPPPTATALAQATPPAPAAASAPAPMAPVTQGQPGQRTVTGGPAIAAADNRADPTTPVRADNVPTRAIAPTAALPPPVPADVAPIPNAAVPLVPPAPSSPPPQVAVAPSITRPPAPAPNQLDEALRRTFPDTAPRQGVDALAATIYFGDGAAGLTEADRAILREVAQLHRERGGNVRVVGYASPDGRGDTATRRLANLDVASRRADGVSRELARFGVPTTVITTSAEGMPASDGVAGAGYGAAGERRVDIYLDY